MGEVKFIASSIFTDWLGRESAKVFAKALTDKFITHYPDGTPVFGKIKVKHALVSQRYADVTIRNAGVGDRLLTEEEIGEEMELRLILNQIRMEPFLPQKMTWGGISLEVVQ